MACAVVGCREHHSLHFVSELTLPRLKPSGRQSRVIDFGVCLGRESI